MAKTKRKTKRLGVAVFACGFAACVLVAFIGAASLFAVNTVGEIAFGRGVGELMDVNAQRFFAGMAIALFGSALNWYVFYLTIPAAWLALGLSIGRFPHRGIVRSTPYRRWGAIWGAVLVALVTAPAGAVFGPSTQTAADMAAGFAGGLAGGALVGGLAGVACAALFLLIVKPAEQAPVFDEAVFD